MLITRPRPQSRRLNGICKFLLKEVGRRKTSSRNVSIKIIKVQRLKGVKSPNLENSLECDTRHPGVPGNKVCTLSQKGSLL